MQGRDVDGLLCATPSHHPITSAITMVSLASSGRRTDQAPTDNINKKDGNRNLHNSSSSRALSCADQHTAAPEKKSWVSKLFG